MACPIVTGKGYTFSEPVLETGIVGEASNATASFTITPQEGFFLRHDHFYVNNSSDFVSSVDFTQDGNNVIAVANLDVDSWPEEDTNIVIDIEYLYLDGEIGLDRIVRVQEVLITPVNDPNVISSLQDGTVIPPEGITTTITGVCGETVELPIVNIAPADGLEFADGVEDICRAPAGALQISMVI